MKEWIITNGIGGFASATYLGGMNSRKYHGLLIAPLTPPNNRTLILSKVDESIEIDNVKYNLFTNESNGMRTEGYKYLKKFEMNIVPIFTFEVNGVVIEKTTIMPREKNAVIITYKISNKNAKTKLNLTPLMNFRNIHDLKQDLNFKFSQEYEDNILKVKFNEKYYSSIFVNDSKYQSYKNNSFKNMHYEREEKRGFACDENHYIPGTFTINIKRNEDKIINFVCTLNGKYGLSSDEIKKIDGDKTILKEKNRIEKIIKDSSLLVNEKEIKKQLKENDFNKDNKILDLNNNKKIDSEDIELYNFITRKFIIASDNFIVKRDSNNLHTIIAGYPWFLDWGRDTFISFEGLLLVTKRFDIAKEVIKTFSQNIKDGLVPNGFSEYDGKPLYNSVDASLLMIDAINKYYLYTNDLDFVNEMYGTMHDIIENYIKGIDIDNNNIYLDDTDFLLVSGTKDTQNTWMDAKVNGKAVTPRNGKAVEINAMFYNAVEIMKKFSTLLKKTIDKFEYNYLSKKIKKSFAKEFYNEDKKCLYDVVDTDIGKKVTNKYQEDFHFGNNSKHEKDDKIRPNQLFAIGMTYSPIDLNSQISKDIFMTCTEKLLNNYGLQTLAKGEEGYKAIYEGNPEQRDSIYHQGPTWPWLLGIYYNAFKNIIAGANDDEERKDLEDQIVRFRIRVSDVFVNELLNGNTIGSISELYDSKTKENENKALSGKGAFAQAWSISEIFRIFLGK